MTEYVRARTLLDFSEDPNPENWLSVGYASELFSAQLKLWDKEKREKLIAIINAREEKLRLRSLEAGYKIRDGASDLGKDDDFPMHMFEHALACSIDERFSPSGATAGFSSAYAGIMISPHPDCSMSEAQTIIAREISNLILVINSI